MTDKHKTDEYRLTIERREGKTYSKEITYNRKKLDSHIRNLSNFQRSLVNNIISALENAKIPANDVRVSKIEVIVSGENLK